MGKNQYVVTNNGKWGVRGEGNSRLTGVYDKQSDAIKAARQIAINQKSELFIQGRNGNSATVILMEMILFHQEANQASILSALVKSLL